MPFIKAESLQLLLTQPRRIMHGVLVFFGASTAWPCTQFFRGWIYNSFPSFPGFLMVFLWTMVVGFVSKRCMTSFAIKNFYFCVASCFYITFARIYICSSTNNSNFFSFLAGWIILKSSLNSQRNGIMMMIFV